MNMSFKKGYETMTNKEKLLQEFECAINAVLGDIANHHYVRHEEITEYDIDDISKKVKFYLGL